MKIRDLPEVMRDLFLKRISIVGDEKDIEEFLDMDVDPEEFRKNVYLGMLHQIKHSHGKTIN